MQSPTSSGQFAQDAAVRRLGDLIIERDRLYIIITSAGQWRLADIGKADEENFYFLRKLLLMRSDEGQGRIKGNVTMTEPTRPTAKKSSWRNSRGYFRFPSVERDWHLCGWTASIRLSPGLLSAGLYWEGDPEGFMVLLPFVHLSLERDVEYEGTGCDWGWMLFRLLIGRQEMRLDLDLNWSFGLRFFEADDFSLHFGPFNVQ